MKVAVIGAGKMGLPLACQIAWRGGDVIACDINEELVATINAGRMPFAEPGVDEILSQAVSSGALRATTDIEGTISSVKVVIAIIPVLLDEDYEANLGAIEEVTRIIAKRLSKGQMICYETTLPVGTTRGRFLPILEGSGLRAGRDFDLVFSPERVKSLSVLKNLTRNPKIVGGASMSSARRAETFYSAYLGAPVINVGTLEAAEFAKLAGMIYRDVNIALANELASYAEEVGLDFEQAVQAANTDGEASLLRPGIGVGGHCTPVYPYFVIQDALRRGIPLPLTTESRRINDLQACRMLDRVEQAGIELSGKRVLILGLSFRPGVKEDTLSPAYRIREEAERRGADVFIHDPLYSAAEILRKGFNPAETKGALPPVIILNTAHKEYASVDFTSWRERGVRLLVDGRNLWDPLAVTSAGLHYFAAGMPTYQPIKAVEEASGECVELLGS